MIEAARCGTLTLDKLEAMTAVCSVGLDMIAVPGDTPAETISAIIADEAAIGMVNSKTTAVRIIPAIGQPEGAELAVWRAALARPPSCPFTRIPRPPLLRAAGASRPLCKASKTDPRLLLPPGRAQNPPALFLIL